MATTVTQQKFDVTVTNNTITVTTIGTQGAAGPQGPRGLTSGFNWLGAWNSSTSYVIGDSVEYAGSSYVAIADNSNSIPSGSPNADWDLYAAKGDTGPQGPQGIQGIQGEQGIQGDTGPQGVAGATWLNGAGSPSSGIGVDGDYYFNTLNNYYYNKVTGNWVYLGTTTVSDHTLLSNIGTNTHQQIDSHIADSTLHFTQASISITESQISDFGNYEPAFSKNTAFNKNFGTTATEVCVGNDARLSDARTPTAHTHTESEITDLQAYLTDITGEDLRFLNDVSIQTPTEDQVLAFNDTSGKWEPRDRLDNDVAAVWGNITGTLSNQTDLDTALAGKSDTGHTHTESDITDLGNYSVVGHTHTESDITDLQAYLLNITGESIGDLSDVTTGSPVTGDVLIYAGSPGVYQSRQLLEADISDFGSYSVTGHTHTESDITDLQSYLLNINNESINDLSDVNAGSPVNGQVLVYGGSPAAYQSRLLVEADISDFGTYLEDITAESITDLSDVLTTMTPSQGQVLMWDTTNKWEAQTIPDAVHSIKDPVRVATTTALPANTSSGSGVGKTLTGDTDGAIGNIDGVTVVEGDRILVKNESPASDNGIYDVTEVGFASRPEISSITVNNGGSVGIAWNNSYIAISSPSTNYYIWFNYNFGGTDPTPGGLTSAGVVNIAFADSAADVGNALRTLIDGKAWWSTSGSGTTFSVTNTDNGNANDTTSFAGTKITCSTTQQGAAGSDAGYILTRATDYDTTAEVISGGVVAVQEGNTNADKLFMLTTNGTITVDTTSLAYANIDTDTADHTALSNIGTLTHAQLDSHVADDTLHRVIQDGSPTATTLYSGSKIETELATKLGDITNESIIDLSDVSGSPTTGNVLVYGGSPVETFQSRALVENDISDLQAYLLNINNESIEDLSNVTLTGSPAASAEGHVLIYGGSPASYQSRLLVEADISDFGSYASSTHTHTINELTDVTLSGSPATLTDGHVLTWDDGTSKWVDQAIPAGALTLDELTDVTVTTPALRHALMYAGSPSDVFVNRLLVEADISDLQTYLTNITGENLTDLSDVDTTGSPAPISGQVLGWDGSKWTHVTNPAGVTDHTLLSNIGSNSHSAIDTHIADTTKHFTTIDGLSDVNAGSPSTGDVLIYGGSPLAYQSRALVENDISDLGTYATRSLTINTQTGSGSPPAYTLVLADAETKLVEMNNASANTLYVPKNASVAFPTGTRIDIVQYGAGATTIAGAGSPPVTIRTAETLVLDGQYSGATLYKRATDEWVLIGRLVAA